MERDTTFEKTLLAILRTQDRMGAQLECVRRHTERREPEAMYEAATRFLESAERLALSARRLPVLIGPPSAPEQIERVIRTGLPIKVGYTDRGWFVAHIPVLLPKKGHDGGAYLRSCMALALKTFFGADRPRRFFSCVLIFRHIYARGGTRRRMRDHDNIECKCVADAIALYLLPDDNPTVCSHYHCSAFGPADGTEVCVVPMGAFPDWLAAEKERSKEELTGYETE